MKEDNEKFTIHVMINGVKMPLYIPRADEEIYRNAEKLVNRYLEEYTAKYRQASMEQILTYVSYQFALMVSKRYLYLESLNKEVEEQLRK